MFDATHLDLCSTCIPGGIFVSEAKEQSGNFFVTLLIAILGIAGALGAAGLGGYWANKSSENSISEQRSEQIQDQRREVYADYLNATILACDALGAKPQDPDKVATAEAEVFHQSARVLLVASDNVVTKSQDLLDYFQHAEADSKGVLPTCGDPYTDVVNAFAASAKDEVG